jgi:hypothetical protein
MATYLLTIAASRPDGKGIRLYPGSRPSQTVDRPAIGKMMQVAALELRTPDGVRYQTHLVTYGVEVTRDERSNYYLEGDPNDAEIKLTVPSDLTAEQYAAGTELWLLAD